MNSYEAPRERPSATPTMAACAEVLVSLGATRWEANPWFCMLLWRMGVEARPPLYAGLLQRLLVQAMPFAALWTAAMHFIIWRNHPSISLLGAFLTMSFITVLIDAWLATRTRRNKRLPEWPEIQALAAERIRS